MKSQEEERRFSPEQYDMLKRCSDKKDMTEWNQWRVNNPEKDVLLEGAKLDESCLESALLNKGKGKWDNKKYNLTGEVYLEGARLYGAHLENAYLGGAHLENAELGGAHLENAYLWGTHLGNAYLWRAHLENASLESANLENADLWFAHLKNAKLLEAHLGGASFKYANLKNANFRRVVVDGSTVIWQCKVDRYRRCEGEERGTDFNGVGLDRIRIDPGTKQLLEYNIRRWNWEGWYKEHWFWRWPVQAFWAMSDYGLSIGRVVATFFALAIIFATVYFVWGALDYYYLGIKDQPGIVEKLFVPVAAEDAVSDVTYLAMVYFRSIYFSIVTMTTLGFGDMYANATRCEWRWWFGHLLLMVQVILGYVLLAALVTRFAVLFTAGGPAGEFAEEKKKKKSTEE